MNRIQNIRTEVCKQNYKQVMLVTAVFAPTVFAPTLYFANQWTGFYMITGSIMKELM